MEENIINLQINPEMAANKKMLMNIFPFFRNGKDIKKVLEHLTGFIAANCPESRIIKLESSIKITLKEASTFTVIQLFFEKSKLNVRYNIKSYDHLIMSEPNPEFVNAIIKEIKSVGYHQFRKENDDLHSTCCMEFIKGK